MPSIVLALRALSQTQDIWRLGHRIAFSARKIIVILEFWNPDSQPCRSLVDALVK